MVRLALYIDFKKYLIGEYGRSLCCQIAGLGLFLDGRFSIQDHKCPF